MNDPLPDFTLEHPQTVDAALALLRDAPGARICAGGTDLIVNMRRGLVEAQTLVDISRIASLKIVEETADGLRIGAGVSLRELAESPAIAATYTALSQAARVVAGPTHREAATLGGNLCLDTRCFYYNQSHWWRKSNDFCLKYRGDICHVAPKGNRCRAAFCGDLAPALMVLGGVVDIAGPGGIRQLAVDALYREDGAEYLTIDKDEILLAVTLPPSDAPSGYEKIRVRRAIDFPLAGVAVACAREDNGARAFRMAITGTNSRPVRVEMEAALGPDDDPDAYFATLGKLVQKTVSPQRTTTIAPHYRRLSVAAVAVRLARGLL
ncbi:MAG: 4-hydroxybenzoyl-CoA reductase subunit beta [Rhodobacteraceae bacterium]|nr:MAG: 4-hydroxybenzoyl-CoA reductase subunit beta [Paracoccaceae bacterium]